MRFDKAKVYTPFNCDEVKVGSKGYVADSRSDLIARVTTEETERYYTLVSVDINNAYPFKTKENGCWEFFYLVEEPKEKTRRPCTREEFVEMLKKQGLPMLKEKNVQDNYTVVIRSLTDNEITLGYGVCFTSYKSLCEHYTLLDGSELWVEE